MVPHRRVCQPSPGRLRRPSPVRRTPKGVSKVELRPFRRCRVILCRHHRRGEARGPPRDEAAAAAMGPRRRALPRRLVRPQAGQRRFMPFLPSRPERPKFQPTDARRTWSRRVECLQYVHLPRSNVHLPRSRCRIRCRVAVRRSGTKFARQTAPARSRPLGPAPTGRPPPRRGAPKPGDEHGQRRLSGATPDRSRRRHGGDVRGRRPGFTAARSVRHESASRQGCGPCVLSACADITM